MNLMSHCRQPPSISAGGRPPGSGELLQLRDYSNSVAVVGRGQDAKLQRTTVGLDHKAICFLCQGAEARREGVPVNAGGATARAGERRREVDDPVLLGGENRQNRGEVASDVLHGHFPFQWPVGRSFPIPKLTIQSATCQGAVKDSGTILKKFFYTTL